MAIAVTIRSWPENEVYAKENRAERKIGRGGGEESGREIERLRLTTLSHWTHPVLGLFSYLTSLVPPFVTKPILFGFCHL